MIRNLAFLLLIGCFTTLAACERDRETPPPAPAPDTAAPDTAAAPEPPPTPVTAAPAAAVNAKRLVQADREPGNWMSHGRTYSEQRFSPLSQINDKNVGSLGLAWSFDIDTRRGIEATSIVVDGVMYTTGAWSIVRALDARTGKLLWTFDPQVPKEKAKHTCCDVVNRGVAVWKGQVFFGSLDGRLFALNARTGKVKWEVATFDPELPYTITGAPRVVKDKVLIGNGGAEFGVRGFLSAYNVKDGSLAWRFYTVPGDPALGFENDAMKMAAQTWNGEWWKLGGGGGTVWDSMAYDPELDLLYFGVGNGTPWNQEIRSPGGGDNLFLSSIVAVRPETGEYVWHYQTTPGESWDYTATQSIILASIKVDGAERKVLMQAPKNGFFYVLDRATGELLSAENYINITWATHVDMETGRPVEVEGARYRETPFTLFPSYLGGHNWHPMSFSPETGLAYIPVLDIPAVYGQPEDFKYNPGIANTGTDGVIAGLPDDQAERDAIGALVKGRLLAWDPVKQQQAWSVEYRGPWNGGTLATAGNLVFQGTADGKLVAYRADTGEQLWDFATQTGVVAPPISFEIDGEQYISVNVGWGGAFALVFGEYVQAESLPNVSRVLTFKLGGKATLPPVDWKPAVVLNPPEQTASPETIALGLTTYQDVCMGCHGLNAVSGLIIPDLRGSAYLWDEKGWESVVRGGQLKDRGMASFADNISPEQAQAIRAYVIQQAHRGLALQQADAKTEGEAANP
ncbi:MAG: PQQ-dependent dehydrogenase, methanol/ethanol family [Halioglobus sp.]|nr:PQQ-dependent dehydrogenase, methanol/ethanol family [Halioglobus sp.]